MTQQLRRSIFIQSSDLTRAKQTTEILMMGMREHDQYLLAMTYFLHIFLSLTYSTLCLAMYLNVAVTTFIHALCPTQASILVAYKRYV